MAKLKYMQQKLEKKSKGDPDIQLQMEKDIIVKKVVN